MLPPRRLALDALDRPCWVVTHESRYLARVVALAIALAIATGAGIAAGEPHSGVDGYLYRPAVDASGIFTLDGAQALERYDLAVKLAVGGGYRPLRVAVPGIGGDNGDDPVLSYVVALHITVAFALSSRLTLVIDTGLYRTDPASGYGERGLYRPGQPEPSTGLISLRPVSNIDPSGGFEPHGLSGPLDARAGFKLQLIDRNSFDLAFLALASIPFGDEEMFLGDAHFVVSPRLAVEFAPGRTRAARLVLNLGANLRQRTVLMAVDPAGPAVDDSALAVLDIGSELVLGAGTALRISPRFGIAGEVTFLVPLPEDLSYGTCRLDNLKPCDTLSDAMYFAGAGYGDLAAYANAGVHYRVTADTTLRLGLGSSFLGARGDLFRAMFGVVWTPVPKGSPTIGDSTSDIDGDDTPDMADLCPDMAEDPDGFQDGDGCPDTDNDGDGLDDARDTCPDQPEDKDGHLDDDGCPERDNDSDGIADVTDRCIAQPEDFDGFEDDDGCPESDNDRDGIDDQRDLCPNRPETRNGIDDDDGCPDARTQTGPIEEFDRIDLRGNKIAFVGPRSARLTRQSQDLLRQVANIVKRRDLKIRVEVHVPLSTRSKRRRAIARARAGDRQLAQRRAEAILSYLVRKQGVSLPALQAVGIGSARPLESPATRAVNERVDFIKREQRQP
ncbi:MAG: OmpA family protein [Proteobacteria bacterium]|nr:OmpA family protein [Pseudomonadota bacterium]